jgi:hypothetical protein
MVVSCYSWVFRRNRRLARRIIFLAKRLKGASAPLSQGRSSRQNFQLDSALQIGFMRPASVIREYLKPDAAFELRKHKNDPRSCVDPFLAEEPFPFFFQ